MTIEYQFAVTGFMFGLIVALDIMCICNIISSLLKKKRIERQKEREELIKLAKLIIGYSRLEIDIQEQYKGLELATDEIVRAHMESIIEACRFTQKKINEIFGEDDD